MKVTSDAAPLERALVDASGRAGTAFEADVRGSIPHRTGRTAAETRVVVTDNGRETTFSVVGPPQLAALEHGANVGPRRGPHMGPQHPIDRVAPRFGQRLAEALGAGR